MLENPDPDNSQQQEDGAGRRISFDRMEWAGAFGDLGTLIPFVAGYIAVLDMDPGGILLAFGGALIGCGLFYRTPFPIQPMKTIGVIAITQSAQTAVITPAAVWGAGLATGLFWLILGVTGLAGRIARLVPRPVVTGIILGLGMSFMLKGVGMMAGNWLVGGLGLAGTLLLLTRRHVPTMFILLLFGLICGAIMNPGAFAELAAASVVVRPPELALLELGWHDLLLGTVLLALPQLPLTLGNAIIAIREENNRLFPDRPVSEKRVATSTGVMNLAAAALGGVPLCHGAGGMAGQVAFGARTGGAPIILGTLLVTLALFFSGSIDALFRIFPDPVLGIMLFIAGGQLALRSCDFSGARGERLATLMTAALAMWNVGMAFLVGIAVFHLARRGWAGSSSDD